MELSTKPGGIPNFFYDVIVFLIPTVLFAIGLVFGMGWEPRVMEFVSSGKLDGWHSAWIITAIVLASYEYGRLAETFSDTLVGRPLRFLHKKGFLLRNKDFAKDLRNETVPLSLGNDKIGSRTGSKWSIYVFALVFTPSLGADLLKRYAWEKLARSSAFSCAVLGLTSVCVLAGALTLRKAGGPDPWQFGGLGYTAIAILCYIILCADFYKRNAWNQDLLITVVPVLARAAESLKKNSVRGKDYAADE
jgi:hypothetical protein